MTPEQTIERLKQLYSAASAAGPISHDYAANDKTVPYLKGNRCFDPTFS